ncbi:MAG: DEAD/DEAH box helicase family protein, partial [Candidatus Auribacterota bacterium]|nr:DEAD/DEAH box helicase family protein [Candidatus Auribacterota bacterium]
MKIEIQDPVICKVISGDINPIYHALRFSKTIWRQEIIWGIKNGKKYKKGVKRIPKIVTNSYFNKNTKEFYTGFLERIKELKNVHISGEILRPKTHYPKLKGITFRDYQKKAIRKCLKHRRGILEHPTGSGKGVILLGLASCIEGKTLILCHSMDILNQIYADAIKFGFKRVVLLGGGNKPWNRTGNLVISTIQTFSKIDFEDHFDYFDCLITDEVHRFSKTYRNFFELSVAPIRIGLTATVPKDPERRLLIEGLVGPIIDIFSNKEAAQKKILSKPTVQIIKIPKIHIPERKYIDIYNQGIVHNKIRNDLIIEECLKLKKKSCLVLIKNIKHGELLQEKFKLKGLNVPFIQGSCDSNTRILIKQKLAEKQQKIVIATSVFLTGVNLPSLDSVFFALG